MREALKYGQSVLDTVDHASKSNDSDIDDSNPSLGDLIVAESFVDLCVASANIATCYLLNVLR